MLRKGDVGDKGGELGEVGDAWNVTVFQNQETVPQSKLPVLIKGL